MVELEPGSAERLSLATIERIGHGYDLHRLVEGRRLLLGGVRVEYALGLLGHSDADVVLHAVIDALLGAAGLGDIGEWFPDNDAAYKDGDSGQLLGKVMAAVTARGWTVVNLDVTVVAERPKLKEYKGLMRARIAELLGVGAEQVNVKAKTNEGVDAVGRGEAIACWATVGLSVLNK